MEGEEYYRIATNLRSEEKYEEAEEYYLKSIDEKYGLAMNDYGDLLEKRGDYENALKYYWMAIEQNESIGYLSLGQYYQQIEKNYEETIKYYRMAIDDYLNYGMYLLGEHFEIYENNYELAILYYEMAIYSGLELEGIDIQEKIERLKNVSS